MSLRTRVLQLQEASALVSLIMNSLLILLILTKSPKQIGSYKYLMIYIATFEICYSILDVIVAPLVFAHGSILLVIVHLEDFRFTKDIAPFLISVWSAFFGSFMALFAIQFIYRFLVASGSKHLKSFNDSRIIIWMLIPLIFGIIWGNIIYFFMAPSIKIDNAIRPILLRDFGWEVAQISYIGPYLYQRTDNGTFDFDQNELIVLFVLVLILTSSICTIFTFAIKCFNRINIYANVSSSQRNKRLQFQLFYALVTQTLIPVILMHLPVGILLLCTIIDIDLGYAGAICSITLAFFPALDPFPVLLIIKSYRTAISDIVTIRVLSRTKNKL